MPAHPHLHCVVPGGGLSPDGTQWIACRPGFFLPVRVLSRRFRRVFLHQLQQAFDAKRLRFTGSLAALTDVRAFAAHLAPARQTEWVVYAKRPFGGPQQVLDYFLLHVLPAGFHRIRDYGLFGNRHRAERLAQCRRRLGMPAPPAPLVPPAACGPLTNPPGPRCPICHEGHLIRIDEVPQGRCGTRLDTS